MNSEKVEEIVKNPLTLILTKKIVLWGLKKISKKTKNKVDDEIYHYAQNHWGS